MRPFVVLLAQHYQQMGWVENTAQGLTIAIEGAPALQEKFLSNLQSQLPSLATIESLTVSQKPLRYFTDFHINTSSTEGSISAYVLPDIATCQACIQELFDPGSRFYQYAFTSCSHCGPRYSIMTSQPYDRNRSSMANFSLCLDCAQDYRSIDNRRFHAQTIACDQCGPKLSLLDTAGNPLTLNDAILTNVIHYLRAGKIVAIKGIGGYQLVVDASNQEALERLRSRKKRPQKPFALMVANLAAAAELCVINAREQQALTSCAAPIVLLKKREGILIADAVAPNSNLLGIMLPYSPLHHLLVQAFGAPLVATSGNRHNEPICIDNDHAIANLAGIADLFLTHNRPILRALDDSIVRLLGTTLTVLRRARGYAPLPIRLTTALPDAIAVGGHLKSTVAVCHNQHILLSQHIGDLDSLDTQQQFETTLAELQQFYGIKPTRLIRDAHDGYTSSQFAERYSSPILVNPVQHHYAHILACMAEHGLEPPLLGIAWDGNGLGSDNTLWGSEFLRIHNTGFERYAHLRSFSLPGANQAMIEPRRSALGVLYEIDADRARTESKFIFSAQELTLLCGAMTTKLNCPRTTSMGRLFDAIASLLGLCHHNEYEGHAAMLLEKAAASVESDTAYNYTLLTTEPVVVDWEVTITQLLADRDHLSPELIAKKFHNTLSDIILAVAQRAGERSIVLSGGCFQNACLVEKTIALLKSAGFKVYCHEKIPPNDGGLALGQLYATKYTGY